MLMEEIDVLGILKIARDAGEAIMKIYERDFEILEKDDKSPLTEADSEANNIIVEMLTLLYPEIPIISEENKQIDYTERSGWEQFWLVDPLDGTKEFIKKNGEFTVNIALVQNGVPVVGVVDVPAKKVSYFAVSGAGAFKQNYGEEPTVLRNTQSYLDKDKIKVIASRSHLSEEVTEFVENLRAKGKEVEFLSAGSSLKFCLVAEGSADVYPRLAPTMEWDTGAADAIVREAGKEVVNYETNKPLEYNKKELLNPWFIVR